MDIEETRGKVKSALDEARSAHAHARSEANKYAAECESSESAVRLIERSLAEAQERATLGKRDHKLALEVARAREAFVRALEDLGGHLQSIKDADVAAEAVKRAEELGRPEAVLDPLHKASAARRAAAEEAAKKVEPATKAVADAEEIARRAEKALESSGALRGVEKRLEEQRTHLANMEKKLGAYEEEVAAVKRAIADHEHRVEELKAAFEKPPPAPAGGGDAPPGS